MEAERCGPPPAHAEPAREAGAFEHQGKGLTGVPVPLGGEAGHSQSRGDRFPVDGHRVIARLQGQPRANDGALGRPVRLVERAPVQDRGGPDSFGDGRARPAGHVHRGTADDPDGVAALGPRDG